MTTDETRASPKPSGSADVRAWSSAVAIGMVILLIMMMNYRIVPIDDAFISYRYAENLVRSGQLVFNLGERVEGATNLLWILVLAALRRSTDLSMESLSTVAAISLLGYTVARCATLLELIGVCFLKRALILFSVFCNVDVFLAMTNGLEAALYAALITEAIASAYSQRETTLGVMVGLLFMTRPEGAIIGLVIITAFVFHFQRPHWFLRVLLPASLLIITTTAFRMIYFGSWIPNSVIAKSFPSNMLIDVIIRYSYPYLQSFVSSNLSIVIILIAGLCDIILISIVNRQLMDFFRSPIELSSSMIVVVSIIIVMRNGGDWMPNFRLLTQYAPCYCLILGVLSCKYFPNHAILAALTVPALWTISDQALRNGCCTFEARTEPPTGIFSAAAERLKLIVRPDDIIGAEAAGLLPFRMMSTRIHDPLGLMEKQIAKYGNPAIPYGKVDIEYTFAIVRPTFMVWHWAGHVFSASKAMRSQYTAFCFSSCGQIDAASILLVRNDRLQDDVKSLFKDWPSWPYLLGPSNSSDSGARG